MSNAQERVTHTCPETGRPYIIDQRGRKRFVDVTPAIQPVGLTPEQMGVTPPTVPPHPLDIARMKEKKTDG